MPSCDLFTSHSSFIIFWERDITSEHHGTSVHILIIVYTLTYFSVFTFTCCYHYHYPCLFIHVFLSFVNKKTGEIDNLSELRWEQSYLLCVCRSTSIAKFLAPLPPTLPPLSPTGDKPYPLHRGNLLLSYISPFTWGNQRRARSHYHLSRINAPSIAHNA